MGIFSKPKKSKWGPIDHIGHVCTAYGLHITQKITLKSNDPFQMEIGNQFQSIVNWLVHFNVAGASDYYQKMFEIGCGGKSFRALWKPEQVTKAKNSYLTESENLKNKVFGYIAGSSKQEEIIHAIISLFGKEPNIELNRMEETWLNCIFGLIADLCDEARRGELADDPVERAVVTAFLGALVASCTQEFGTSS